MVHCGEAAVFFLIEPATPSGGIGDLPACVIVTASAASERTVSQQTAISRQPGPRDSGPHDCVSLMGGTPDVKKA